MLRIHFKTLARGQMCASEWVASAAARALQPFFQQKKRRTRRSARLTEGFEMNSRNLLKRKALPFFSAGFTLLETVMVVAFFSFLSLGMAEVFLSAYKNYNQQSASLSSADAARRVAFGFANELRNAASGNDGAYPLNKAGDSEIIFYSGADLSGAIVKRIRYYMSGNTLYRGVITPTGNPLSYNAPEIIRTAQTNLENSGTGVPAFYYFDGNYSGAGNPLVQPVNLNQVKFIKTNLVISSPNAGTFTVTSGAALRNLKNNLGN